MSTYPLKDSLGTAIQADFLANLNSGDTNQDNRYQALVAFCQTRDAADNSPCAGNWSNILQQAFHPNGNPVAFTQTATDKWDAPAYTWQVLRYISHWLVKPDTTNNCFQATSHAITFMQAITVGAAPAPSHNAMVNKMVADINGGFPGGNPGDIVLSMSP